MMNVNVRSLSRAELDEVSGGYVGWCPAPIPWALQSQPVYEPPARLPEPPFPPRPFPKFPEIWTP